MRRIAGGSVRAFRRAQTYLVCRRLRSYRPAKFGTWWRAAADTLWEGTRDPSVRPAYLCGATLGALQAKKLQIERIYLLEFGVAKGGGFKSLIEIGRIVAARFDLDVVVVGFDNRTGLPESSGFRDHPEIWSTRQFAMDESFGEIDAFARERSARLVIGDVADTLPAFLDELHAQEQPAAVAFCSIDVDFYTSTRPITAFFRTVDARHLLPATVVYVDDVFVNWTYSAHTGELLALSEFNQSSEQRKFELKHEGLKLFALHAFDHPARQTGLGVREPFEIYYKDLCKAVHYKH